MARRVLNRKGMRADYDAAERRKEDEERDEEEEEVEDEEDEEEDEDEESDEEEAEDEDEDEGDEDDEERPKKKKKKKPVKAKAPPKKTTRRAAKVTRMRVVWGVFSNNNSLVTTYAYPKKGDAEEHARKLTADKRSTHFVQPVKEPIEEPKEAKEGKK